MFPAFTSSRISALIPMLSNNGIDVLLNRRGSTLGWKRKRPHKEAIMFHRMLSVFLMALALTMGALGCQSAPATHQGKVVEVGAGTLTMTDTAGANQHTHEVALNAVITCEGKPCGLPDVKVGDMVTVTTATMDGKTRATKIEATKAG